MRKLVLAVLVFLAVACNSNEQSNDSATGPLPVNVDNVKGNIPDTLHGTTLNTPMERDSISGRDSLQR